VVERGFGKAEAMGSIPIAGFVTTSAADAALLSGIDGGSFAASRGRSKLIEAAERRLNLQEGYGEGEI
jgi:hypothetical protein